MYSLGVVEFGVFHQTRVIFLAYLVNNSILKEVGNKCFKRLNTNTIFCSISLKKRQILRRITDKPSGTYYFKIT